MCVERVGDAVQTLKCFGCRDLSAFEVAASDSTREKELAECCSFGDISSIILEKFL